MTNLTDNLTKEIRASSLDQERPSWLVGFVNEQYLLAVRIKSGHISILFTSNSDHENQIIDMLLEVGTPQGQVY